MAVYRQLKAAFWESPFVMGLTPEERTFFVYMLLNPATTHSGVYKLSIRMMMAQCSYGEETILELIQKFVTWKKIAYDPQTHEFMVLSWMKHNRPSNPKVFGKVGKEVRATKSKILQDLWSTKNPLDAEKIGQPLSNGIGTVTVPYSNGMDTVSQPLSNGIDTVQNPENQEIKKDINSSVLGYSSVDLLKEVGCSLPGLKTEEPEHKYQGIQESGIDLYHMEEVQQDQPGEDIIPHPAELNLKEANSQDQKGNQEPKKNQKPKLEPKQPSEAPHPGSADPSPEEQIIKYFNQQMCTGYQLNSGNTRKLIHLKLSEGFSIADFHTVIDKKILDWQKPKYRSNLVPHVLFGDKFEAYLQQTPQEYYPNRGCGSRIPPGEFQNLTNEIVEVF